MAVYLQDNKVLLDSGSVATDEDCCCGDTGACCGECGSCEITTEAGCTGTYQGDGTTCEATTCELVSVGCDCNPTSITFSNVDLPGCCIDFGASATFIPCSPVGGTCYDLNQSWPLTPISAGVWGFSSGGSNTVELETLYSDAFCSVFDSDGGNSWGVQVSCDSMTGLWSINAFGVFDYFGATNIVNPFSPVPNDCTCGSIDPISGNTCSGDGGTAVLTI